MNVTAADATPPIASASYTILCACSEFSSYNQRVKLLIAPFAATVPKVVPIIVLHNGIAVDELQTPFHPKLLIKTFSPEFGEAFVRAFALTTVKNVAR
jgi:hypothetical protein